MSAYLIDLDNGKAARLATEDDYRRMNKQLRAEGIRPTGDTKRQFWDEMRSRLNDEGIITRSQLNHLSAMHNREDY